jgi:PAS domain S-box-containing protein
MNGRGTILVVDDTAESLRILTEILQPEGYRVRPANSGELALASIAAQPPDLILLDIRMPGMDGFEVCRRLKAGETTRGIPVIFQSAATDLAERLEGLRLGAVDYISKPFQREELLARVKTHLELARLRENLELLVKKRTAQLEAEISERRQAEAEKRKSEANYRRIVDTAIEGILALGVDHKITFVNARMAEMLGYTREDMSDRQLTDFMFEEDAPDHLAKMENHRRGLSEHYERRFRSKGGATVWTLVSATPIFDKEQQFQGSFGMFTDTTERKLAEEALRRLNNELEQRVRARTKELERRNYELEQMNKAFVGRELKMVELKQRIAELDEQLSQLQQTGGSA